MSITFDYSLELGINYKLEYQETTLKMYAFKFIWKDEISKRENITDLAVSF